MSKEDTAACKGWLGDACACEESIRLLSQRHSIPTHVILLERKKEEEGGDWFSRFFFRLFEIQSTFSCLRVEGTLQRWRSFQIRQWERRVNEAHAFPDEHCVPIWICVLHLQWIAWVPVRRFSNFERSGRSWNLRTLEVRGCAHDPSDDRRSYASCGRVEELWRVRYVNSLKLAKERSDMIPYSTIMCSESSSFWILMNFARAWWCSEGTVFSEMLFAWRRLFAHIF